MASCKGGVCALNRNNPLAMQQMAQNGTIPMGALNKAPKSSSWSGTPAYTQTFGTLTPQQQQLLGQTQQSALGLLNNFKPFNFAPIAQQAQERFYGQTVPTLAERFTALGGQDSSAFQGALASAGRGLDVDLAALEQQYGLQQQGLQQNLLANLLSAGLGTRAFESAYIPKQQGFGESLVLNTVPAAIRAAGAYFGGF